MANLKPYSNAAKASKYAQWAAARRADEVYADTMGRLRRDGQSIADAQEGATAAAYRAYHRAYDRTERKALASYREPQA